MAGGILEACSKRNPPHDGRFIMAELVFLLTSSLILGGLVLLTIIANFLESRKDRRK